MTIKIVQRVFLQATTAAVLLGALFVAAPRAEAQQFAVGVRIGAPAFGYAYGPAYGPGPGYYDHLRWEREQARRDAWLRHEDWQYHRDFNGYPPRAVPFGGGWR